jgi:protein-tyrosine phosphatase
MGEAIFKRMVEEKGIASSFCISSFGTSDCEEDNPVYPPAQKVLREKGYNFKHRAKQITLLDVKNADYILVMDSINLRDLTRLTAGNYGDKIYKLGHFLPNQIDIDDPWYTGEFERTYNEIYSACTAFLAYIEKVHASALTYDKFH